MDESGTSENSTLGQVDRGVLHTLVREVATRLDVSAEGFQIDSALDRNHPRADGNARLGLLTDALVRTGKELGLRFTPVTLDPQTALELLFDRETVVHLYLGPTGLQASVTNGVPFGSVEMSSVSSGTVVKEQSTAREWKGRIGSVPEAQFLVAQRALQCDSMSQTAVRQSAGHDDTHHRVSPQWRFLHWLKLESKDIWSLTIFAIVVSVLDLATPLAVEQMVTSIGFATFAQPLIWLAVLLFGILSLSAVIKGLQFFMIEILQRRLFVRIVGDLAERFSRLDRSSLAGVHGPEMANRFFDVMTMQKTMASLLIDGLSLIIQTITGLLLLALYSPYLLVFDMVLIICMTLLLWLLGRNAVTTSIEESYVKYRIAAWLQELIGCPFAFQIHGGEQLAVDRANRMTVEYLVARRKHFIVLIRQTAFALFLYAVSISTLLSLGGWLVISSSISIGQLVASVSVVALVVGAFAKIGKSLESFYDLMSATDKVGHLIDLKVTTPCTLTARREGPRTVTVHELILNGHERPIEIGGFDVQAGNRFAVTGEGPCGKSLLMQTLCGMQKPASGFIEIGGADPWSMVSIGSVAIASESVQIFEGTLRENVTLHRRGIELRHLRQAMEQVELWSEGKGLPQGIDTLLQSGGFPLSASQQLRLMIARAVVAEPEVLLIDGLLDRLPTTMRYRIWERLASRSQPWTLIITTNDFRLIQECDGSKAIGLEHDDHVDRTIHG